MTKLETFRLVQHIPVGVINIAFAYVSPVAALLFGAAFLVYEVTQGSNPHKDIRGYCWGLGIGGAVWFALSVMEVIP